MGVWEVTDKQEEIRMFIGNGFKWKKISVNACLVEYRSK